MQSHVRCAAESAPADLNYINSSNTGEFLVGSNNQKMSLSSESCSWCSRCKLGHDSTGDAVSDYFSDHLVYEILLRTPAESLLVFKSVCKAWYAIIKNPSFVKEHRDLHATREESYGLVFISETRKDFALDLTIMHRWCEAENVIRILGRRSGTEKPLRIETDAKSTVRFAACHGLVGFYTPDYPLLMCNPVTREFVTLPKPRCEKDKEMRSGCGFGFDTTNNEYKVVQLFYCSDDNTLDYAVLTLGTTLSWRRHPIQPKHKLFHPDEICLGAILVDGSLYWHAIWHDIRHILCFDVTPEKFKLIRIPMLQMMCRFGYNLLLELDKSLCFINLSNEKLHTWRMKKGSVDKGNLWKYRIIDVSSRIIIPKSNVQPLPVFSRSKKIYMRYESGLACYNTESRESIAPVFMIGDDNRFDFVVYTKSIISLKDILDPSSVSILST